MSKKIKIAIFILAVIVGVVFMFWPRFTPAQANLTNNKTDTAEQGQTLPALADSEIVKPEGMSDDAWARLQQSHAIMKSSNQRIDFYGKIIDQNGDPVVGVELELRTLHYADTIVSYLKNGDLPIKNNFTMTTDSNGKFMVEGEKGTSFQIEKMKKEGYERAQYRGQKTHFSYGKVFTDPNSDMFHRPDPANPIVYQLWKKGETEPLIKKSVDLFLDKPNGVNEVYYTFGKNSKPSPNPTPGWDLKVAGINQRSKDRGKPYDDYWEVTLTAGEGGGIQLTDSHHANLAPESGYQKSITVKSTDQQYHYQNILRMVYFKIDEGKQYAASTMRLNIGSIKNGESIIVQFRGLKINPNGSRNLEFDKSKQIK